MKKIIVFIAVLFSFVACDLSKLDVVQTKSFIKYLGEDGNTQGVDLLKLDDGYLLLGNNISRQDVISALLIKVDMNGNLVWANRFENILGASIAKSANGYFIVGDSIKESNPLSTSMSLIKTDLEGTNPRYTSLDDIGASYHGRGIIISSTDEVVVSGYTRAFNNNQTFLYGYDQNLTPTWNLQKWPPANGQPLITSTTLIENSGDFIWTTLLDNNGVNELHVIAVAPDDGTPKDFQELLDTLSISNDIGGFNATTTGGVLAQTVNNASAIALATYSDFMQKSSALIKESTDGKPNRVYGQAVLQNGNGYVVLGSTDKHLDGSTTRSDLDFYITKVSLDGSTSVSNGFTNIIGGTGNEVGAAIVESDDGGFVFLGTMKNTNEVELMVLVKVNSRGELIN